MCWLYAMTMAAVKLAGPPPTMIISIGSVAEMFKAAMLPCIIRIENSAFLHPILQKLTSLESMSRHVRVYPQQLYSF